jgi:hypothetical protein
VRASQRANNAKKLLISGAVLRLHSTDLKISEKTKRFFVFAVAPEKQSIAKLYFDSNCPPLPYQIQFEPDNRQYLDRKSYLDCSEIYEDNYSRILNQLISNPKAHIGQMDNSDLELVKIQLKIATTIPPSMKQEYGIT